MAASNMVVQNNIAAMNTHRNMKNIGVQQMKASEKLSSGYRINRAADDAAGLAISEKMRSQIRGLNMASKNVDDAISLIKTAEGGMQGIDDMLHRVRELVDFAANDTNEMNAENTSDRQKIQDEIDQLVEEIDDMSERVEFNRKKLINGSFQDTKEQLANAKEIFDRRTLEQNQASAKVTGLQSTLGLSTDTASNAAGVTAYARLNSAQAVLDNVYGTAAAPGAGSFAKYKVDSANFAAAQATYDTLINNYNDAMAEVRKTMGDKTLEDLSKDNFVVDSELELQNGTDVAFALKRYADAANALGIDELGMGTWAKTTNGIAVTGAIKSYTKDAVDLAGADKIDPNIEILNTWKDATDSAKATTAAAGIKDYQDARATFRAAEVEYKTAVSNRDVAQAEVDSLNAQLTDAKKDRYNATVKLTAAGISHSAAEELDNNNISKSLHFQVGANGGQSLIMSIGSLKSDTLGIGDGKGKSYIDVMKDSGVDITATIDVLDQALSYVTTERSKLGAAQNRMEYTQQSLDITSENISDAESRIRDADMAKEMMNFTKSNILQQVSVSMMAQANQLPQSVLQLLR